MRSRMYEVKKNKDTKEFEFKTINFNYHSSLLTDGKVIFEEIFTREFARIEFARLLVKYLNGKTIPEEIDKLHLFEEEFEFSEDVENLYTQFEGCPAELIDLLLLTLYSHCGVLERIVSPENDTDDYNLRFVNFNLGMEEFYKSCKKIIPQIESGATTLESAIDEIKPLYNDCTELINHDAVDKICKKWVESTKEKNTRAFIVGLLSKYKLTRSNRIDKNSPLKSQSDFERYVAMWLVTGGTMVDKKKDNKSTTAMMNSFADNIKRALTK